MEVEAGGRLSDWSGVVRLSGEGKSGPPNFWPEASPHQSTHSSLFIQLRGTPNPPIQRPSNASHSFYDCVVLIKSKSPTPAHKTTSTLHVYNYQTQTQTATST